MAPEAFADWGWRLPFLLSVILLAISLWIRLQLHESPVFQRMKAEQRAVEGAARRGLRRLGQLQARAGRAVRLRDGPGRHLLYVDVLRALLPRADRARRRDDGDACSSACALAIGARWSLAAGWLARPHRPQAGPARRPGARGAALLSRCSARCSMRRIPRSRRRGARRPSSSTRRRATARCSSIRSGASASTRAPATS